MWINLRYLLSPSLTNSITAQFYELVDDKVTLTFNNTSKKWELLSLGQDYFNISDYLALSQDQQFLAWFEAEDGLGNILQTHKYKCIYDNSIGNSPPSQSLFNWNLGTNSTDAGIIIFGSDEYRDSTISLNVSSILPINYGNFPGTYSFGSDDIGSNPGGWTCIEPSGTSVQVIDEYDGHKNVLELYDDDDVNRVEISNDFDAQEDGAVEFWWADNSSQSLRHYLRVIVSSETGTAFAAYFNYQSQGTIRRNYDDQIYATGISPEILHHIKIVFDDTAQEFEFFVDDVSTGVFPYSSSTTGGINRLQMHTRTNSLEPVWHYIDAIGYRVDPNYNIGDNLKSKSTGESDISRVYIYGSEDQNNWSPIGRAYYSGEEGIWNYYWDGDALNPMLPENYNLKVYAFDRAGNFVTQSEEVNLYDYTEIVLLTDVVFGQVFEYNSSLTSNVQSIEGIIGNYTLGSPEALWDVIAEWYDPNKKDWIPLAVTSSTIISAGDTADYSITWDINKDTSFVDSIYNNNYEYLPLRINEGDSSDLWGSWGVFSGSSAEWQPIVIGESGGDLDISIFSFNDITGWELDSSISSENTITSISDQVFTLFDINNDNKFEIVRKSQNQVDVIYLDSGSTWVIQENITGLSGYDYLSFDIERDSGSSDTNMAIIQKDQLTRFSFWKYAFDANFNLNLLFNTDSPLNFEPSSIKIVNYFSASDRKAILVGGLMEGAYYSQLLEFDSSFEFESVVAESLLGKISVIEYETINGQDTVILGVERVSIGKMDAVIALKRTLGTEIWTPFELSGFDETKFEILDMLTIQENNAKKLLIASKTGLYQTRITYLESENSITSPVVYTHEVYSVGDLTPEYYPTITLKNSPINSIAKVSYRLTGDNRWLDLSSDKYHSSRTQIQVDLASIWSNLAFIKIAYAFESFEAEKTTAVDPSFNSYGDVSSTQGTSAFGRFFTDSALPFLWLNPTTTYSDPYADWNLLPNGMTYQNIPVISGLGNTVVYPDKKIGGTKSNWGPEYITATPTILVFYRIT